jgi:hypothetical protein
MTWSVRVDVYSLDNDVTVVWLRDQGSRNPSGFREKVVPNDVVPLSNSDVAQRDEREPDYRRDGQEHYDLSKQREAQSFEEHDEEDSDRRNDENGHSECEC